MTKIEQKKFWEPFAAKEKILEEFQKEKEYIEEITGTKLTNIEAVGLRMITKSCMKEMVKDGIAGVGGHESTAPYEEIPARFFNEFYDIPPGEFWKNFSSEKDEMGRPLGPTKATKEYFRKKQEEKYLI